jgi:hypothetical protein
MPGYASQPNPTKPVLVSTPDTVEEFYDNIFYGLKFDPINGSAYFERIDSGEVIKLPETGVTNSDDYVHYFTSPKKLNFTWSSEDQSRLHLEVT